MIRWTLRTAPLVALALAAALAGCSSSSGSSPAGTGVSAPATAAAAPDVTTTARAAPTITASVDGFGHAAVYPDGITVTVVRVVQGRTKGSGAGEIPGRRTAAFTLRFDNGTSADLDLTRVVVEAVGQGATTPAAPVYEGAQHDFGTVVPAGSTATAKYTFVVSTKALHDVRLTISFDDVHVPVSFEGPVKITKS